MVRRRRKSLIIWTVFFDLSRPRSLGRKVPKNLAVRNPTVEEIAEAVKALGLECEIVKDKKYPRTWYMETCQGYVRVYKPADFNVGKAKLLKLIAEKLKELRQKRQSSS